MTKKFISVILNEPPKDYPSYLKNGKEFFSLGTEEADNPNLGFNKDYDFVLNLNTDLINLLFLKEVSNDTVDFWEEKIISFARKESIAPMALIKKGLGNGNKQFKIIKN